MATRYYLSFPDPDRARGNDPDLAFRAHGAEAFAQELQDALRDDRLFQRWRDAQDDPEAVDPALGTTDPAAVVQGTQDHQRVDLLATTCISGTVLKHRLRLLAGSGWELRDVKAG